MIFFVLSGWINLAPTKRMRKTVLRMGAARARRFLTTKSSSSFSHLDVRGQPAMVDVGAKQMAERFAKAESRVRLPNEAFDELKSDRNPKGAVMHTAILGGIMAAKRTAELIPLCHQIPLSSVKVEVDIDDASKSLIITCAAKTTHKTGVEMEALTGASIAALIVYDMLKAISHDIVIESVRLIEKRGGKSDFKAA